MPGAAIFDIRDTLGATLIGLLVSTTLFGVTLAQTWIYFWKYHHKDPRALQFFIVFLTILDTFLTCLSIYVNYWYLILNFGNIKALDVSIWAFHVQILIGAIIAFSVQLFYARRVYIVSKSMVCPILIAASAAIAFFFGVYYTAREILLKYISESHSLTWISCVGMAAGAISDVLIAGSMCWHLYRQRTGFSRTDSIISILMAYSVNSGLLTCLLGAAVPIVFAVAPASQSRLAIFWVLSKCYINTLLAMLNSRDYVRDRSTDNPENAYNLSSMRMNDLFGRKSGQPVVSVTVHNTTTTDLAQNKSVHDERPPFDTSDIPFHKRGQSSESSA